MYQRIKTEFQLFFVLVVVAVVLFFWSTTLRPEGQPGANSDQSLEAEPMALLEADLQDPAGVDSLQTGSPANPTHLFEPRTHFQGGGSHRYFMPLIQRSTILFFDNFSDDDSGWPEYSTSDCFVEYNNDEYRVEVKDDSDGDDECFGPAPEDAEREVGDFSVKFRRTDGSRHYNAGIYINGKGGDEYYLFRVEHDDDECDWRLVRREDGDDSNKRTGTCDGPSNGYNQVNTLRIRRVYNASDDAVITVYLNGVQLGSSYTDGDPLGGEGIGVFANEETNNDKVVVRFDDFTVRRP